MSLVSILDFVDFRPGSKYWGDIASKIGVIESDTDFQEYYNKEIVKSNPNLLYMSNLIKFLQDQIKDNKGKEIKKRFIIYAANNSGACSEIKNAFFSECDNGEMIDAGVEIRMITGAMFLWLHLGNSLADTRSFVRIYSSEKGIISCNLQKALKDCLPESKFVSLRFLFTPEHIVFKCLEMTNLCRFRLIRLHSEKSRLLKIWSGLIS